MINISQFEKNVNRSFQLAKKDITQLYDHLRWMQKEISDLKEQNKILVEALEVVLKNTTKKKQKKRASKKRKLVASRISNKLHKDDCFFAKNIKSSNKVTFENESEALKLGFNQCACVA